MKATYCADAAAAVGFTGAFKAWTSSGSSAARDRIKECGPWYTPACTIAAPCVAVSTPQFQNLAALKTQPSHYMFIDEKGFPVYEGENIWTFSTSSGATGNGCTGVSYYGSYGDLWSSAGTVNCSL